MKKRRKNNITEIVQKSIIELHSKITVKKKILKKHPKKENKINPGFIKNLLKISIENAIEDVKNADEDVKETLDSEPIEVEEKESIGGGYGTITKSTSYSKNVVYLNYEKNWAHIGSFKSKSMYENSNDIRIGAQGTESTRQMVDIETLEKAAKHFKYFVRGDIMGDFGYVPPTGLNINSKDWEKYRLMSMMSVYRPLLAMKRASA